MLENVQGLPMDRRRFIGFSATAAASTAILLAGWDIDEAFAAQVEGVFTIVHTNDIHGRARVYPYVKGLMDQLNSSGATSVLISAGDAFAGSAFANESAGLDVVSTMKMVGYDMMTVGNHEYMMKASAYQAAVTATDFSILASNVVPLIGADNPKIKPYEIVSFEGKKIAFIGIAYNQAGAPDMIASINAAKADAVAEGAEVFVGISHLGVTDGNLSNRSTYVAQQCPWFSVIVDGHSHTEMATGQREGNTLIVQTGAYGAHIGVTELTFYDDGTVTPSARLIKIKDNEAGCGITPDSTVSDFVDSVYALYAYLDEVLFMLPVFLSGETADVRTGETNLGNLVTDAMRAKTGAAIALATGASLRNSLEPGEVTVGMLRDTLLAETNLACVDLTGARILQILEDGLAVYPTAHFLFPHTSGLSVAFDATKDPGSRIVYAGLADGTKIDPSQTYSCAVREDLVASLYLAGIVDNPVAGVDYAADYGLQTEAVTEYANGGALIPETGDRRLRVVGTSYVLSFEGNSAVSGSVEKQTYSYGNKVTLPRAAFSRPGYLLVGWADSFGNTYDLGQVVTDVDVTFFGEVTLFAQWEALVPTLVIDKASYQPGDVVTFSATEFEPEAEVIFTLHSTPVEVARVAAAADGSLSGSFVIPNDVEVGEHKLVADNGIQSMSVEVHISAVPGKAGEAAPGNNKDVPSSTKNVTTKTADVTPLHLAATVAVAASVGAVVAATNMKEDEA